MLTHKNIKPIKPKRVVIFGSKGFVASSLKNYLIKKKINTLSLSKKEINLLKKNSIKKLTKIIKSEDTIVFISAIVPVKNTDMFFDNIAICKNFAELILVKQVKHIIYISSDAVYLDTLDLIDENYHTDPSSLHGLMHLVREKILLNIAKNNLCILRPTLIYGEKDPHNGYGPNQFIRGAMKNFSIELFGKGEEKRDHVWINDVTEIIYRCLIHTSIGKLNIVTGKVISFFEIATLVKKIAKNKIKINENKRIGKMPHKGYRAFNPDLTLKSFPDFRYNDLKNVIKSIYNKYI